MGKAQSVIRKQIQPVKLDAPETRTTDAYTV